MNNKIYIGDSLEIMSSNLFNKYNNKIKMIYIDPPYNTQTKKSYNDNVSSCEWGEFIKERLLVSKKLLKDDGVVFISIDDNEYASLKIICDFVYGNKNFVGTFITKQAQRSLVIFKQSTYYSKY